MKQIFKNLAEHKGAVFAIVLLLIIQAYCDLALPAYTSAIVDVGIGQSGIEYAAMEEIREETFEGLLHGMDRQDAEIVKSSYRYNEKTDRYERTVSKKEDIEAIHPILSKAMATAVSGGQLTESTEAVQEQMALVFVQQEYQAMGYDLSEMQTRYLLITGAKMLGLSVVMIATAILGGYFSALTGAGIGRNLRERIFRKVISFSNQEMDQFSVASLITRSTNDIQQIQMVSTMMLRVVLYAPIIGIGGILKVINTKTGMGWIIALAVGLIAVLILILLILAMPKFKIMQSLVDRINLVSREILTGLPVIRAFSREKYEEDRFEQANRDLMRTQLFTNRVMNFMMPTMMLIMNGITVLIVWVGAQGIEAGNLQVGEMIAFITYTMQIVMSFLMLTVISILLPRAGVAANRIEEVLNTNPAITDPKNPQSVGMNSKGVIRFEDVSFTYAGAKEEALSHITFEARPGETTAIIGSTGCGKSTLLNLIPRFYDVTKGHITIDGIDVRDMKQEKLRSLIGYVPQKGVLFSGTIESNLKFADDKIADELMEKAAEIAQATEFIEEKEEKYQSAIAQGGTNVSGGQKQRLSIARAIAKQPKIFLFDDSFSALDYKTDKALRARLKEEVKDATVIIVAQRINTILHADNILVLEDGCIVGSGTHEELLDSCEAYTEIAKSQLSENELKGGR